MLCIFAETVEKVALPLFRVFCTPLQRTRLRSHVCGARSIFADVPAAGENGFNLFRAKGTKLGETFFDKLR